jgi:hypothetical protein
VIMNYLIIINCVILAIIIITYILLIRKITKRLLQFKIYQDETNHKLDILIRVSHKHEQFIDTVKRRSEELNIRNRKGGAR